MKSKDEIKKIAEEYISNNNIEYSSLTEDIEEIKLIEKKEIRHGKKEGEILDVYIYNYAQLWGIEERGFGLYIDAASGEPLYIITPHGYLDI
jgi:hypothetical protein|nr:hypothetical protein [uncultured Psychroserpens sp.]